GLVTPLAAVYLAVLSRELAVLG
ncbi:MAG: hypothetical protein QOG95_998, partial [Mycobacterium sp.]|nr:hypothetical protein [Mycobacterium sp.]